MSKSPNIGLCLVFGASGYVGSNLVERLLAHQRPVRASARSREVIAAREWRDVELAEADALVPSSLTPVLEGVDVAYYLVHSMAAGRDFGRLDLEAAGNFAHAAARAGVRRIVYLGGLVPADARSEHLVSRAGTGDRLRAGAVPVTEIRAGIIVGPGSAAFEVIRDLVNNLPVMLTPRWVSSRSPPIALDNLLEYLVAVPGIAECAGRTYDAAGPEMLSYAELMRVYGECVGKRPRVIPVPVLTPRLSALWLFLVTSVPTPIARALIAGLEHDIPADGSEIARLVPQHLLGYRESVERALRAEREQRITSRWTEGSLRFRRFRQDHGFYAKRASGATIAEVSPAAAWRVICAIGGRNGYFYARPLWALRGLLDVLTGGPGLRGGRRDAEHLRLGDAVDSWRVIALEPERRLALAMGMRAPGAGVLELSVEPLPGGRSRITATAYWHPAGVWGLLYWYSLLPAHLFLFDGMTRAIAQRARQRAGTGRTADRGPDGG